MGPRLLVDGYNVVHAWDDLKTLMSASLEQARDRLVGRLSVYSHISGWAVTVVFDAHLTSGNTCQECHGQVAQRDQLFREVNLSMGGCMDCHRAKKASLDCLFCHDHQAD